MLFHMCRSILHFQQHPLSASVTNDLSCYSEVRKRFPKVLKLVSAVYIYNFYSLVEHISLFLCKLRKTTVNIVVCHLCKFTVLQCV